MIVEVLVTESNIKMLFRTQIAERFTAIGDQLFAERSTYNLLAEKANKVWIDGNVVKDQDGSATHVVVRQPDGSLTSKPIPPRQGQLAPQGQQRQQLCV